MTIIKSVSARQILDSRGNPTIEVDVHLEDGSMGRAAVPSGASTGSKEALELRDGGTAYLGKAVTKAIANVQGEIAQAIVGQDLSQAELDKKMIELDGTPTKSRLGANAILGVSMAFAVAQAAAQNVPLYKHIQDLSGTAQAGLPMPILNVLNGGAHANWTSDIQEYMLFPVKQASFADRLRKASEVFHHLGKLLVAEHMSTNVGNEGGYAPAFTSNEQAFQMMSKAVEAAGYTLGAEGDFMLGIDAAATEFYEAGQYQLKRDQVTKNSSEMVAWMAELTNKYAIASLEDPLADTDWQGWSEITELLGDKCQIVGDDLTVTNPKYVQQAIDSKSCNAVIIKLNQIGTVSETLEAIKMSKDAGWKIIISHRSGETEDTFISHLAVGTAADQIKSGAPSRTDRTAKYNEVLRIEEQLNQGL